MQSQEHQDAYFGWISQIVAYGFAAEQDVEPQHADLHYHPCDI